MATLQGHTKAEVARRFGVGTSTVCKWVKKASIYGLHPIPTSSSRPKSHPHALRKDIVDAIVQKRLALKRSAEVVHAALADDGIEVSLASVKRTLDRTGLLKKRSSLKRFHGLTPRPIADTPGALVQVDTVHLAIHGQTVLYVYTLIDVHTRFAYAAAVARIGAGPSLTFLKRAQVAAPFLFGCVQTDNGPEFSTHFTERVGVRHRHTRVRKSNDNAHVERFNRTLREELLDGLPVDVTAINRALPAYLEHYNNKRHHFGLHLYTPMQALYLHEHVQAIG